jgi:hypothetical protein
MDIAQRHLALDERDIAAIRSVTSVNEENRGLRSGVASRVAMDARADRGSTGTTELIDNLMFAHQLEGELTCSLIEQFYTEPKVESLSERGSAPNEEGPDRFVQPDAICIAAGIQGHRPW